MSITKKIQNALTVPIAAAALLATPSQVEANSVEVMAGHKYATLDVKAGAEIAPKTNLLVRNRTTADYNNNVSNFGFANLSYDLGNIGGVVEFQFTQDGFEKPRVGVGHFAEKGNFSVYSQATASLTNNPNLEVVVNMRYTHPLTENTNGVIRLENVSNWDLNKHNFSAQRLRIGTKRDKIEGGVALNTSYSASGKASATVGVYLQANF